MRAWIFNAALYCETCAADCLAQCKQEGREDYGCSQTYPQGPYADGGGEADCPQHCDACGVFLENPLTTDGYEYVRSEIARHKSEEGPCLREWAEFYELTEVYYA